MRDRVVCGRALHQAGQRGRLGQGEPGGDRAEVAAAGRGQAIVAVPEVGDIGVHPEDLRLAVRLVQLDAQHHLLGLGGHPAAAGCVEHLGQLLVERCAALLGAVAGEGGGGHPGHREHVDARLE